MEEFSKFREPKQRTIMKRRTFIEKSLGAGAVGVVAPSMLSSCVSQDNKDESEKSVKILPIMPEKDDISIAQWSLVEEIRQGKEILTKYLNI
jgi:hypothetical protein